MLLWVGGAPSPCLFPIGTVGLCLKVSCSQSTELTPRIFFCCYKVCWLVTTDPCLADHPRNLLSLVQRLILMTHTTTVILPWSHWEVYLFTFLQRRGAYTLSRRALVAILVGKGLDRMDLTEKTGKFTFILFKPFHFAIALLLFEAFFLAKQIELVHWLFANHPFSSRI